MSQKVSTLASPYGAGSNSRPRFYQVHQLGETTAEVTEGSAFADGVWERARYDWSAPGTVRITVPDSNAFAPGGSWTYQNPGRRRRPRRPAGRTAQPDPQGTAACRAAAAPRPPGLLRGPPQSPRRARRGLMTGRPRTPGADTAIMGAALALLRERCYAGLTLDDVAARAGVGKSSLYRRFRDRADLATTAVGSAQHDLPEPTGDRRPARRPDRLATRRRRRPWSRRPRRHRLPDRPRPADPGPAPDPVIEPRARHSRQLLRDAQQRGQIRPTPQWNSSSAPSSPAPSPATQPLPVARTHRRHPARRPPDPPGTLGNTKSSPEVTGQ